MSHLEVHANEEIWNEVHREVLHDSVITGIILIFQLNVNLYIFQARLRRKHIFVLKIPPTGHENYSEKMMRKVVLYR